MANFKIGEFLFFKTTASLNWTYRKSFFMYFNSQTHHKFCDFFFMLFCSFVSCCVHITSAGSSTVEFMSTSAMSGHVQYVLNAPASKTTKKSDFWEKWVKNYKYIIYVFTLPMNIYIIIMAEILKKFGSWKKFETVLH